MTSKDCSVSIDRLAERGEDLPPIMPQWCFRASGREFVKYAIIARKK